MTRSSNILSKAYFATMPLHAWKIRGSGVRMAYKELIQSDRASKDELVSLQNQRTKSLVAFVYREVPYYRKIMVSQGLVPSDFQTASDLALLPVLEKKDVRLHLNGALRPQSLNPNDAYLIKTSGSTGEPFKLYANREQLEFRAASTLRGLHWAKWGFGDRQMRLWHQTIGMSRSQVIRERLDAWMLNRVFVPAFELDNRLLEQMMSRIDSFRPKLLDGYAESLNFIAYAISQGLKLKHKPTSIMTSAQILPIQTRRLLEQELGSEVYDKYGSREFSGIAYECDSHNGHHVVDECYHVEVVRGSRKAMPGEVGEVLVTDFLNRATPLIRYKIGDLAVAGELDDCTCGRGHTRLGDIQGRTQAIVRCSNGRWLPGTFFAHFFKEFDSEIRHYQIVQSEHGSIVIRIVPATSSVTMTLPHIVNQLREFIGDTKVVTEVVDEIPLLATGKRSPVVSTISPDGEFSFDNLG